MAKKTALKKSKKLSGIKTLTVGSGGGGTGGVGAGKIKF